VLISLPVWMAGALWLSIKAAGIREGGPDGLLLVAAWCVLALAMLLVSIGLFGALMQDGWTTWHAVGVIQVASGGAAAAYVIAMCVAY
jgi:hypothetical protein